MAKIGLNNFRYGLLTENPDGTASYGGAHKPAVGKIDGMSIPNGSIYTEIDTGVDSMYDEEHDTWYEIEL